MKGVVVIRNIAIYCFAVSFFLLPRLLPILFLLAFFLTLFTAEFKENIKHVFTRGITWLSILFFVVYALSALYSVNTQATLAGLELKLSFLVFPMFLPIVLRSKKVNFNQILDFLFLSVFISFFISFVRACYRYFSLGKLEVFFSSDFTFIMHPSYLAVSLNLILLIVLYRLAISKKNIKSIVGSILILTIYIVFTASKIGLILLFLNYLIFSIFYAVKNKKIKQALISVLVIVLSTFLLVKFVPKINTKFTQAYQETFYKDYSDANVSLSSTGQRIVAWKTSIKIIQKHPMLGVGIGDVRDELNREYKQAGFSIMEKHGLDSHQQFLQTQATVGVAGSAILMLLFLWLFLVSIKRKSILLFLFTFNLLLFSLTESMLETQAGVLGFLFFVYIFEDVRLKQLLKEKIEN